MQGQYIASCKGVDFWNDLFKLQNRFVAIEAYPECSLCTHLVQFYNEDGTYNDRFVAEKVSKLKEAE